MKRCAFFVVLTFVCFYFVSEIVFAEEKDGGDKPAVASAPVVEVNGLKRQIETQGKSTENEEQPFFFVPGIVEESKDQFKQYVERRRYFAATDRLFHSSSRYQRFVDADHITYETDVVSTAHLDGKPRKMLLILDNFKRMDKGPDAGKVRVTFFGEQYFITERQLEVVHDGMLRQLRAALEMDYQKYYALVYDPWLEKRARSLGITKEELVKHLDDKVDGTDVTWRELNGIPTPFKESDFVPVELHLGYTPSYNGVLGLTLLNTGIVYYNPQAWIMDYLVGKPLVLGHEMVHVNAKLQSWPFSGGFDPELLAMIPEGLEPNTQYYILFHFYLEDLREICRVLYGFDFVEAFDQIFHDNLAGNQRMAEEKYREVSRKLRIIQAELYSFMRDVAIPEFYAHQDYWMALNDKLQDDNGWLRILMVQHYDPTILDDPGAEPGSVNDRKTMKWLFTHKEEILEMAKKAYAKSGEKSEASEDFMFANRQYAPSSLIARYKGAFNSRERQLIEQYFRRNPRELSQLQERARRGEVNLIQAADYLRGIIAREGAIEREGVTE